MFRGENIICLAAAAWQGMWARAQQFMTIFARSGNRILYVDPPFTLISPLKNPALRSAPKDLRQCGGENIDLYSPPVILPFGNMYRTINRINQKIIAGSLKRLCRELAFKPTICWTYLPNTVDLRLPAGVTLVYDCADEHTAFPGLINKATVLQMEMELFARADVSLASARELCERKKELAPAITLVPNGADVEHFKKAMQPGLPAPPELKTLARPVVGYVGAVSAWFDQEMLATAARAHPDWSFVLVGPMDTDVLLLNSLPNVHLLGRSAYSDLPAYLKCFDIAVIPFKINDLTTGVNPVKLYEYLAAGRPVVSSDLPEVRTFRPHVAIAGTPAEFVRKLEEELAADSPIKRAERLEIAGWHSWEARAESAVAAVRRNRKRKI
ncbi:MAG: glycosyltransferase [Desulfotomaculaceae bacterium]|nr:glycosyltransferase [Desulfotomaculaceae bacterium]